jgi:hypothetical protein
MGFRRSWVQIPPARLRKLAIQRERVSVENASLQNKGLFSRPRRRRRTALGSSRGEQLPRHERKKLTVAELAQEFLDHAKAHTKPKTYEFYCYFVVPFVERFGGAGGAVTVGGMWSFGRPARTKKDGWGGAFTNDNDGRTHKIRLKESTTASNSLEGEMSGTAVANELHQGTRTVGEHCHEPPVRFDHFVG